MELFFDLVFVYAVSNSANLIHHLNDGILPAVTLFQYVITFLVFLSVWMTETLYLNRYGYHGFRDNVFLLFQMFFLLYLANAAAENWNDIFVDYSIVLIFLQLCNIIQYILTYPEAPGREEKGYIRTHICSLLIFSAFLFAGIQFDSITGSFINVAGLLLALFFPLLNHQKLFGGSIHFPYLIERFGLFVILTFGEVIISILPLFQLGRITFQTLMVFMIVALMFLYYVIFFDQMLDKGMKTSGLRLIYTHIPLILSLGIITAVFHFIEEQNANPLFVVCMLYGCLLLYFLSIFINSPYLKSRYKIKRKQLAVVEFVYLIFLGLSLILSRRSPVVICLTAAMLLLFLISLLLWKWKKDGNVIRTFDSTEISD